MSNECLLRWQTVHDVRHLLQEEVAKLKAESEKQEHQMEDLKKTIQSNTASFQEVPPPPGALQI